MPDENQSAESIQRPDPPQATRLNKLAVVVAAGVMSLTLLTVAFMVGSDGEDTNAEEQTQTRSARRGAQNGSFMDRPPSEAEDAADPFTGLTAADLQGSPGESAHFAPADLQGAGHTPPPLYGSSGGYSDEPYYNDPPPRRGGGGSSGPSEEEQALKRALRSGLTPQGAGFSAGGASGTAPGAAAYGPGGVGPGGESGYDDGYLETLAEIKEMFPGMGQSSAAPFGASRAGNAQGASSADGGSRAFLAQAAASRQGSNYIAQTVQRPRSPFEIREGTLVEAYLLTGIHSDLPGEVVAQVSRNVYDSQTQQALLIPKGTRLIGTYDNQVALDQSRLLVAWTRMVFPDGRSINLPGLGSKDAAGASGLTGRVNRHYWRAFGNAMMLAVVGGGLSYAAQSQRGRGGAYGYPTPGEVMAGSVATELSRVATELLRGSVTRRPTIRVREGTPFNVFMNGDLALAPYQPQDGFMQQAAGMTRAGQFAFQAAGRQHP